MLLRAHVWSRSQKWLIIVGCVVFVALSAGGVYIYERDYRGPGEEILFGTWEAADFIDGETGYFRFKPDQTLQYGIFFEDEFRPVMDGRWYAGGSNIYIRFSADDMHAP